MIIISEPIFITMTNCHLLNLNESEPSHLTPLTPSSEHAEPFWLLTEGLSVGFIRQEHVTDNGLKGLFYRMRVEKSIRVETWEERQSEA